MTRPRIEVKVKVTPAGTVTRHYAVAGFERALCGRLTDRPPTHAERWAQWCGQCEMNLSRMERG